MAKPNKVPTWATDGGAEITEPSIGKRAVGWILERPAYQYFNWLFNAIGTWLGFVDSQFADDGVKRVAEVADLVALKALTPADGDVRRIAAAVYVFKLGDTTTADDVLVVADDGGTGRWLHVAQPVAGVVNGLAALGSDGQFQAVADGLDAAVTGHSLGDGPGVEGVAGAGAGARGTSTTGPGMWGRSTGSGAGGEFLSGTGPGMKASSTSGAGGQLAANAQRGGLHLVPQAADPSVNTEGDLHYKTGSGLRVNDGTKWQGVASLNPSGKVVQDPASKGVADGVAELGPDGVVPSSQLGGFVAKKWGVIKTGAAPESVSGSETFTLTPTGGNISVFFAGGSPMPNADYAVIATVRGGAFATVSVSGVTTAGFVLTLHDVEGVLLEPNSDVVTVGLLIIG